MTAQTTKTQIYLWIFFTLCCSPSVGAPKVREVVIIAHEKGFSPQLIVGHQGEELAITFASLEGTTSSCLYIPDLDLLITARRGQVVTSAKVLDKLGTFTFYCPGRPNFSGKIVIINDPSSVLANIKDSPLKGWIPK